MKVTKVADATDSVPVDRGRLGHLTERPHLGSFAPARARDDMSDVWQSITLVVSGVANEGRMGSIEGG